jgi:putative transposase
MVDHPRAYRWSSYRAHADGAADALLSEHAIYHALGRGGAARRKAYRALFRFALDGEFVAALRAATNGGWALGDARFAQLVADAVGRRAAKLTPGRPNKDRPDERRQLRLL